MQSRMPAFLAALALLAGCVTVQQPAPPVLSLTDRKCDAAPALQSAMLLVLDPKQEGEDDEINFDMSQAACLDLGNGKRGVYGLAALPDETIEYTVSVESVPFGNGVFAPSVTMLDSEGKALRQIPGDAFVFRGAALSVLIRRHSAESYLLVTSNPEAVGTSFSKTVESLQTSGMMMGSAYIQTYTGVDQTQHLTYAHNGAVTVRIEVVRQASN